MRGTKLGAMSCTARGRFFSPLNDDIPVIVPLLSVELITSSEQVFHSPHAVHRPNHLGLSAPQELQKNAFFTFATMFEY